MNRWYVVQTQAQAENKANFNLSRQSYVTYLPRYRKRVSHARRVQWLPRPLFPRYLFVLLDPAATQWRAIQSTIGVARLICQGDDPAPVPHGIVEEIQSREDENGLVLGSGNSGFKKGDPIEIIRGPMAAQVGLFDCMDDQQRVVILLQLLGREVKARVPVESVTVHL